MLSKKQHELLDYINKRDMSIERWMNTATIASLIKRRFVEPVEMHTTLKLHITTAGKVARQITEYNYRDTLRDVAAMRKRYK